MRILLIIAFLLFPSIGFSGMGDVYFCESTKLIELKDGEVTEYKNEKFKFKRTSNGLIFGSEDSYFKNLELTSKGFDVGTELFSYTDNVAGETYMIFNHEKGIFSVSQVMYQKVVSIIGQCSVF